MAAWSWRRRRSPTCIARPAHPYTRGLLASVPDLRSDAHHAPDAHSRFAARYADARPPGCPFAPRCPQAMRQCVAALPPMFDIEAGRQSRCWLHHPEAPRGWLKGRGMTTAGRTQRADQAFRHRRRAVRTQPQVAQGRRWRRPHHRARRNAGAGGRERLRKVDAGAHPHPPDAADAGRNAVRRHRYRRIGRAGANDPIDGACR